ncbi:hypothetical protein SNN58_003996 [Cronobacter dublinensis]|uniref:hypothetical protein n=1 Tax=Cronobacter dublinensis TaxID=413497 RepID=UPI0013762452|nr:hypothetical protein [Cronobacter dublinensis]EGT5671310.1 hypothetical protein [Cronobacter dublinensis subsp. dublinensis]EGT5730019.1 hypothetical protein [Cronobacter dublinensis subsp. dublinensis]EGT5759775.1 hypothetical protein [Cronobacter dublinensis subsp. dublinensis]ELY2738219.1 hypothetical protein [Cronobacter dublinensis]ELY2797695.1 hypothetical protein [Cronobacter dublinensis]
MAEINSMINALLSDRSHFNEQEIHTIIDFVNELDDDTLYQFENAEERSVMYTYEQLLNSSRPVGVNNGGRDIELGLLNSGSNNAIQNNRQFFDRYNTRVPGLGGRGGNIYNEATKISYDYAGKIISGIGAVFGVSAAATATATIGTAAANAASSIAARTALLSAGGVFGLAGGALVILRNTLADRQTANNKRFLETVKKAVKVRTKVNKFFEDTNLKVVKDPEKAKKQLVPGFESHPARNRPGADPSQAFTDLSSLQRLVIEDFAEQHYDIRARVVLNGSNPWYISLETLRGGVKHLTQQEMTVLQNLAGRL